MKINEKLSVNYGNGISGSGIQTCESKQSNVEVRRYSGPDWGMSDGLGISNTTHYSVFVGGKEIRARYSDKGSAEELAEVVKNGSYKS